VLTEHVNEKGREALSLNDEVARRHTARFRKVANRYPRRVAEAYGGDLIRALADSDEQVKATVAAWEKEQGHEVTNWYAVGAEEREGD
jgi:hypothetical protein